MQPIAASVCTAISASSSLRALTTSKPERSISAMIWLKRSPFEIVGIKDGSREQKREGEAPEVVHLCARIPA
jgi:hypothetical protein